MTPPGAALRLLGVRYLQNAAFLSLERRHYTNERNEKVVRVVVRHPGAVVVVPMISDEVILIRQRRVAVSKDLLELPAGKLEDETPEESARRECAEEIGYVPGTLVRLHVFYSTPGFSDEQMWLFLAEDLEPVEKRPQGTEEEQAEIVQIPLQEALAAVERGEIEDAKSIVGIYAAARRKGIT